MGAKCAFHTAPVFGVHLDKENAVSACLCEIKVGDYPVKFVSKAYGAMSPPPTLADRTNEKRQQQYDCPGVLSLFFVRPLACGSPSHL